MAVGLAITSLCFLAMGVLALADPDRFLGPLGLRCENRSGRNEVRAVYGGYGIAMAGVCAVALANPALRPGLTGVLAAALLGMVAGRLWSVIVDRGACRLMWGALAVELSLACLLVAIATGALDSPLELARPVDAR